MIAKKEIKKIIIQDIIRHDRNKQFKFGFVVSLFSIPIVLLALYFLTDSEDLSLLKKVMAAAAICLVVGIAIYLFWILLLLVEYKKYFLIDKQETYLITRTGKVTAIETYETDNGIEDIYAVFDHELTEHENIYDAVSIGWLWQKLGFASAAILIDRIITIAYTKNRTIYLHLGPPDSPESDIASHYSAEVIEKVKVDESP